VAGRHEIGKSEAWAAQRALVEYYQGFDAWNTECENQAQYTPSPAISASGTFYTPHSHSGPPGRCDNGQIKYFTPSGPYSPPPQSFISGAPPSSAPPASSPVQPWVVGTTPPESDCDACPEKPGVPAQVYRPFRSKEVRASTQVPVVVSDGLFTQVVSFRVPVGYNCVIQEFGQGTPFPASFTDIRWRFTVDGLPQHGLDNILSQQGTVIDPSTVLVKCIETQTVALEAIKLTPGNVQCSGAFYGYIFMPQSNVGDDHWKGWMGF
jgi:hypothetical protein